jgi:poly(A) polymerase
MRRMLALPRIAATLRTMYETGVLMLPDEALDHLSRYERLAARPSFEARLALLCAALGAAALKARWRLSNDELGAAEAILAAAELLQAYRLNDAGYRFAARLADGTDVAAVQANWTQAGKSAVVQQLQGLEIPKFPETGGDLVRLGLQPGLALGRELDRLEREWIDSGFALDRAALLARAGKG